MNNANPFKLDFDSYILQSEPEKQENGQLWQTAIGLQQVDGLTLSKYLYETAYFEGKGGQNFSIPIFDYGTSACLEIPFIILIKKERNLISLKYQFRPTKNRKRYLKYFIDQKRLLIFVRMNLHHQMNSSKPDLSRCLGIRQITQEKTK